MKIRYDAEAEALSITFRDTIVTTVELADGIVAEYDADGKLVGLEVLDLVPAPSCPIRPFTWQASPGAGWNRRIKLG